MGSTVWGADVAQLRTLAQTFGKASENLLQQSSQLGQSINSAQAWKGPDAVRFTSEWNNSHRTVLMNAASALKKQSRFLLTQADEQETASNAAHGSGGGPMPGGPGGGPGGNGDPFQLGPNWLADGDNSPFRNGWDLYNTIKAYPDLRAGIFDLVNFSKQADGFKDFWSKDFRAIAKAFQDENYISKGLNSLSEAYSGDARNLLNLAEDGKAAKFFSVGGKALGGLGVGLDTLDAFNNFSKGEIGEGIYSSVKAGLGVACFAPPPIGTAAMVASGALAIYDNVPFVHDAVNATGKAIGDAAVGAWNAGGKALDAAGKGLKKLGGFLGF